MKLLLLSKENISLARAEAEAILGKGTLIENILLINTKKRTERLAYTKMICSILFEAPEKRLENDIKSFDWQRIVKESFALSAIIDEKYSQTASRKYGGIIYDSLKHPKVDLDNPKTRIIVINAKNRVFVCMREWENTEDFEQRKPDNWPAHAPITLGAKLSRACINLTGAEKEIYDPFCGIGGILIEAGLMGLKAVGSDISKAMLEKAKANLEFNKVSNYKLFQQDAAKIKNKFSYIVTDPPYGRSSKKIGSLLYEKFISSLGDILVKRAVIVFPSHFSADSLLKKAGLRIAGKFSVYVHKSLTRTVYVLEQA